MQVESADLRIMRPADSAIPNVSLGRFYTAVFSRLRPEADIPDLHITFRRYASASARIALAKGRLEVRIADSLSDAPDPVHEALADILVCKLLRQPVPPASSRTYRSYLRRPDVRRQLDQLRSVRGRKHVTGPRGDHYDLNEIFDAVNFTYFFGLMAKPTLGWSRRSSKTLLGHYDPSHNMIVLSPLLDSPDVPRLAVEYVMYHEMLHVRHPVEQRGSRRCVHTKAFKLEERKFTGFAEAKRMLHKLGSDLD